MHAGGKSQRCSNRRRIRVGQEASEKTWVRSFYFLDPDGIMLEFCATLQPGIEHADLPVNEYGIKSNGQSVTGL
ncbi:MAG: hypothetical protein CM15mP120_28940 [Pseudomonadota bacterium]|nr:MAG: hypothetical protein CM15mP120_28940 [Pseudomonadota bacterium]